jgi:uncharacterized membrane protein YeiH
MKIINIIEVLGIMSFALSGAISGIRKRLDIFGVLIITFVSSVGGGTVRDILIGSLPVAWMQDMLTVSTILFVYVVALFFYKYILYLNRTIFWLDTVGLALFSTIAVEKGIQFNMSPPVCVALGAITGCFGGIIRDVILNEIPYVFRKDIYASACIAGGSCYFVTLWLFPAGGNFAASTISIAIVMIIRIGATYLKWRLPLIYKHEK